MSGERNAQCEGKNWKGCVVWSVVNCGVMVGAKRGRWGDGKAIDTSEQIVVIQKALWFFIRRSKSMDTHTHTPL